MASDTAIARIFPQKAEKPLPMELHIALANGFATTEDGALAVVRTMTADGEEVRLIASPEAADSLIAALAKARATAAEKVSGVAAIQEPSRWEVATAPGYDGVIVAFDRGQASQTMIGLGREAAREMGRALISQAQQLASRPGIVTPSQLILPQ